MVRRSLEFARQKSQYDRYMPVVRARSEPDIWHESKAANSLRMASERLDILVLLPQFYRVVRGA